jgi:predicted small lipoprotein YifL
MCAALVTTGCGLKGPLYLPNKQESVPPGNKDGEKRGEKKKLPQNTGTATPDLPTDSSIK